MLAELGFLEVYHINGPAHPHIAATVRRPFRFPIDGDLLLLFLPQNAADRNVPEGSLLRELPATEITGHLLHFFRFA